MAKIISEESDKRPGYAPGRAGRIKTMTPTRIMKCVTVTEGELQGLSSMNGACTLYVGLTTSMFGIGIGLIATRLCTDPKSLSPQADILTGFGAALCIVLAIVFGVAARCSNQRAKTDMQRIKDECQE